MAQKDDLGNENVIAYASRKLLDREQKRSSIERECLAIVFALTKWEQWLWGHKIIVITDHRPLQYLSATSLAKMLAQLDGKYFCRPGTSGAYSGRWEISWSHAVATQSRRRRGYGFNGKGGVGGARKYDGQLLTALSGGS